MAEGNNKFWMVWTKSGHAPKFTHSTQENADAEAFRLAKANPGKRYFVLEAKGSYKTEAPPIPEPRWTPALRVTK